MNEIQTTANETPDSLLPERYLRVLSDRNAIRLRRWWQRLQFEDKRLKQFTQARAYPRAFRAELRRCDNIEAVLLTEGFRRLWLSLDEPEEEPPAERDRRLETWATIAAAAATLRDETRDVTLGKRLGSQKQETGKPRMSDLRFQQLLSCDTAPELIVRLRRALALADRQGVSVVYLGDNIAQWWQERRDEYRPRASQRLAFLWTNDYFGARSAYMSDD